MAERSVCCEMLKKRAPAGTQDKPKWARDTLDDLIEDNQDLLGYEIPGQRQRVKLLLTTGAAGVYAEALNLRSYLLSQPKNHAALRSVICSNMQRRMSNIMATALLDGILQKYYQNFAQKDGFIFLNAKYPLPPPSSNTSWKETTATPPPKTAAPVQPTTAAPPPKTVAPSPPVQPTLATNSVQAKTATASPAATPNTTVKAPASASNTTMTKSSRTVVVETTEALSTIPTYMERIHDKEPVSGHSKAPHCSEELLEKMFYEESQKVDSSLLAHGYALASLQNSSRFSEAAYLGKLSSIYDVESRDVYLNTHEPFCIATCGVQGAGKSHTLGVILENCLVPLPAPKGKELIRLNQPLTALVLHYDQNVTSVCEATGLICPVPSLRNIFASPTAVPREKMVVLVSPSYYLQRKQFYGDYCVVKPLMFKWANLTADHIKKLMCLDEGDNQLYVASMLTLLRGYQRSAVVPEFQGFLRQVQVACNIKSQEGPLSQRMALLEAFVAESNMNSSLREHGADLLSCLGPGVLVVADLTDPLLSSTEANGIFQVLTEQFRTVPLSGGCGKLLALDECHKFMCGESTDGLSNAIINAARLMRHDGLRLVVSTQSPKALAPELLELVTVAILHRFHSRDWYAASIPLVPFFFLLFN
eukprot:TRINITY_DN1089_c0_g2_i2.p1 TRINITY_DN1089_c0_g2~~TRINITY_DN1089_c0_g2_i2.p1  ORF type:complete len:675 (+),score=111.78 TRINITY_DN1089_c0_g2_i2:87-2027(+)